MSDLVKFLNARLTEIAAWAEDSGDRGDAFTPESRAYVLADVAAKRAILDRHAFAVARGRDITAGALVRVIWDLAGTFAAHPDYQETWRP